jgi:hypothetical protein
LCVRGRRTQKTANVSEYIILPFSNICFDAFLLST